MALETFARVVDAFRATLSSLPDKRTGKNSRYQILDAALSAFSVFFTQTPSFLAHQRKMSDAKGLSNAQTLFGVHQVPSDNHIRNLLDGIAPERLYAVFDDILQVLEATNHLSSFRSFAHTLLMPLDGTEYFSSTKVHCKHCSTRVLKSGETRYFHTVLTPVIASPARAEVIPLVPEFVMPQDGHDKQDCENAAAKRWVKRQGKRYRDLRITVLGDDLYCRQPLCELLLAEGFNFIVSCLPTSHQTLYEHLAGIALPSVVRQQWTGKCAHTYTYRYLNQVPLRDTDDALLVNWCELVITDAEGTLLYQNAFATSHSITDDTVEAIVAAGRTRWKVENENNNTLKTKGYHLEHNFGHGQDQLAAFLATLNILAMLFHTLLALTDTKYRLLREHLASRKTFFNDLRALTRYVCFEDWNHLLTFMLEGLELELPSDTS